MDNNQEQLHNNTAFQDNTFPEEFEMKWGTDDLPKGMKRRGSQHHNSHSGSHHSTHSHRKSSSHHRQANQRMDEGDKRTFQDLIYREKARKKEAISSKSIQDGKGVSDKIGRKRSRVLGKRSLPAWSLMSKEVHWVTCPSLVLEMGLEPSC